MKKKTNEEFLMEIEKMNPTYSVLSEYVNIDTNVHCFCNIHNIDFYSTPYNLLKGKCGCEVCRREKIGNKNRKTKDEFIKQLMKINDKIEIIGEYTNCKDKIQCRCQIHNEFFEITPDHLMGGETGCQSCIDIKQHNAGLKSHDTFLNQIKAINPNLNILGRYDGSHVRIEVECLNCGNIWTPFAGSLVSGFGCPRCASSKGEKKIKTFLESYNITFTPQKTFKGLVGVGGKLLSYDFYLPDFNLLIEYQGQFHDGTVPFQTEGELLIQKEHDKRKATYAQLNHIKLLEIWYWDYNKVEEILIKTLDNLGTL